MTSAADLFGVQEIDLNRDTRRALVADIDTRLGETEELVSAREAVAAAEAEIEQLRKRQRELDGQVEDMDAKLRTLEEKLYGGAVRNPKELSDLQKDVDSLKHRRSSLDDQDLAVMEAIEAATSALAQARKQMATVEADWQADQQDLQEARQRAEQELGRLEKEREQRLAQMDRRTVTTYEALRQAKQGRAVARIERGACQGCRLSLPTHIVQRARAGLELVQCPSCERILVGG